MIRSMTGFGRGHSRFPKGKITVEIKTVNHKYFDDTLKLPMSIALFEDRIKEILQKKVRRGKIYLTLTIDGSIPKGEVIDINAKIAKSYYNELLKLKKELDFESGISVRDILSLPGVVNYSVTERSFLNLWPKIKKALDEALDNLVKDRELEGKSLHLDLSKRVKRIEKMVDVIKARTTINIEEYKKKFAEKIRALTNGREIDMGRLEMEAAIYAKNSDISEEITRLKNHLANFKSTISASGEVGKKLDFIAQELHRETNTVGSKASDFRISKNVIEIKGEVEKIREQVKNLE